MCRSFISIIFSMMKAKEMFEKLGYVSILYKYHISLKNRWRGNNKISVCRSFISIIFPFNKGRNTELRIVSILYKYHISQKAFDKKEENVTVVSILYKYHISLTKYSTFWTLIDKNIEKQLILAYIFRPPPVFRLFFMLKSARIWVMVENLVIFWL